MKRHALGWVLAALSIVGLVLIGRSAGAMRPGSAAALPTPVVEPLPPGATIQTVAEGLGYPIAMAFDSAGRLFYTEQYSAQSYYVAHVRLIVDGMLQASPVITFSVVGGGEAGLLGITLDPNFNTNHYIYVYYTGYINGGPLTSNVARFEENNGSGSNPIIIFSAQAGGHFGGNIHFGADGKLYITIGDGGHDANAQDVTVPNGKIHRINSDGSIPLDNPVFTQTGALPSFYAIGLRNSFDFTFDPSSGHLFASENGPDCDDEMNRIVGGYNYGWRADYPCDDVNSGGPDPTYNTIRPLWYLPRSACCEAPTGIEVYKGTSIPQWQNDLFMDSLGGRLYHFHLDPSRTQVTAQAVVDGVEASGDIATGPDGAFYYIELGGYGSGRIKRITGTGSCSLQFSDAPPGSTFYEVIRCLACRGIVGGYPCGGPGEPCPGAYYRPKINVTRGQVAKIVVSSAGIGDPVPSTQQTFEDVTPGDTFQLWIEQLAGRGYIGGYPCGELFEPCVAPDNRPYFRPNNPVTRGQLAKIDANAAQYSETPTGQTFEDVPPGSTFYLYSERIASRGIIGGYPCGGGGEPCVAPTNRPYFRPNNPVTRGQTAKIVAGTFFPNCQTATRR